MDMTPKTRALWEKANEARHKLRLGKIGMDEAKLAARPYINHINEAIKTDPEKYGRRKVNISSYLR